MHLKPWHIIGTLTLLSCLFTLAQIPQDTWLTTAAMSLSLGVAALALMGLAALLGSRLRILESLLGGLDRVYLAHKWLAVWALIFASVHFTFRAGSGAWDMAAIIALPSPYPRFLRQLSLLALMLIIILALNRKIPYRHWRWWHKLSGPLFVIVVLHWLTFRSPIALDSAAGIWLSLTSAVGITGALYKLWLYPFVSPHAEYEVVSTSPGRAGLLLELAPVARAIEFVPGQFGFLSMKEEGLREPHPFTIASATHEKGHVQFAIRDLGDYTHELITRATPGMHAEIYLPFGRFERPAESKREVWIAGGVGISPFMAWLQDEAAGRFDNVTLFYFFTPEREFPPASTLNELARRRGAEFIAISTGPSDPQFARRLRELARNTSPNEIDISFCGPKGLLKDVQRLTREAGIPQANIRYEYFDFR